MKILASLCVEYIHWVEALYEAATHPTQGHNDDTEKAAAQKEERSLPPKK